MMRVVTLLAVLSAALFLGCASKSSTTAPPSAQPRLIGPAAELYPASIADTESAVTAALKSLGLVVIGRSDTEAGRLVEAKRSDNTTIFVNLFKRQTGTEVSVRVGNWGDEPYARRVLAAVRSNFPKAS